MTPPALPGTLALRGRPPPMIPAEPGTVTLSALWSPRPSTVHTAPANAQSDVAAGWVKVTASCEDGLP